MTEKRVDRTQPPDPDKPPVTDQTASNAAAGSALTGTGPSTPALPPPGSQGHVDVTGIVPEGIHIDPDITEGHPGYEESRATPRSSRWSASSGENLLDERTSPFDAPRDSSQASKKSGTP